MKTEKLINKYLKKGLEKEKMINILKYEINEINKRMEVKE